jgi:ABC-type nitrate/sulfonate/bicarbonate transport system permease component
MTKASSNLKWWYELGRYLVPMILVLLWEATYWIVGEPAMGSPWQSVTDLFANYSEWLPDVGETLLALFISFLIAAVFGSILGFFIGLSGFWTRTLSPLLIGLYSIPKVTLYPIFLLVFGLTIQGRIAFSVFHGIFPILIMCMQATRMIPNTYLKVAKVYQLNFFQKARMILIPAIMPQLVAGLRMGFSLCFLGLIIAEMFASSKGLGFRLMHYMSLNRTSSILALILIIVFVAFFCTFLFLLWQERVERKIGKSGAITS